MTARKSVSGENTEPVRFDNFASAPTLQPTTSLKDESTPTAGRLNTTLLGKYRIQRLLGEGGCGIVYLATHLQLRTQVAIKFLLSHWASRSLFRERFRREARALAILSHPRIVGVHDFGDDAGDMFLIMEYVRGEPLTKLVRDDNGQPMPPARASEIIDQLLDVLSVVHERGIVHRERILVIFSSVARSAFQRGEFGGKRLKSEDQESQATPRNSVSN